MAIFNVLIGLSGALIVGAGIFLVNQKWLKVILIIAALSIGGLCYGLSQHYLYPRYLLWRFENSLHNQPVFVLIQQNHPIEFQAYMQKIKQSFKKSADVVEVTAHTAELLNQVFNVHLAKSPNEPINLYLQSTIELYRYLFNKLPQAIVMMETGKQMESGDVEQLSQDLVFESYLIRLLEAKKLIIQDSIKSPVIQSNHDKAKAELEKIYDNLSTKFGAEIIRNVFVPSEAAISPKVSSLVILEFYGEILATGKETAGEIMRYIGSLGANSK